MKTKQMALESKIFKILSELPHAAPKGLHWDEFAACEIAKAIESDIARVVEPVAFYDPISTDPREMFVLARDFPEGVDVFNVPLYDSPQEAAALEPVNAELLEALEELYANVQLTGWDFSKARAAIAKSTKC